MAAPIDFLTTFAHDLRNNVGFEPTAGNAAPDERGWAFVESLARETEPVRQARIRSAEINATHVTPAEGAALRMLAHAS